MSEDPLDPLEVESPEAEINAAKLHAEAPRILGPPNIKDDYTEASKYSDDEETRWKIADINYQARAGAGALAVSSAEKQQREEALTKEKEDHAKTAEEAEEHRYDPVTELLLRRGFTDETERRLASVDSNSSNPNRRGHTLNACVFIGFDVKGLKDLNDSTGGHDEGDILLKNVADLIKSVVREGDGDIVGRIGGDEFAAAVFFDSNIIKPEQMKDKLYERIQTAIAEAVANGSITGLKWLAAIRIFGQNVNELLRASEPNDDLYGDEVQHFPPRDVMPGRPTKKAA